VKRGKEKKSLENRVASGMRGGGLSTQEWVGEGIRRGLGELEGV